MSGGGGEGLDATVFNYSVTRRGVVGDLAYAIGTWSAGSSTPNGSIVTGLKNILHPGIGFATAQRGTVDSTSAAGTIALTNLTASDSGTFMAVGTL